MQDDAAKWPSIHNLVCLDSEFGGSVDRVLVVSVRAVNTPHCFDVAVPRQL